MGKRYAMYIGRWQNFHAGHEWLINQQFNQGKNVWIAIRDVEVDENNPKSATQIYFELEDKLQDYLQTGRLLISIIPDIESVNYGRGVGYDVVYHEPPAQIGDISGTKIRNGEISEDGTKIKN
jgi:nicotinamide mononucleotide adenylyltransferase